MDDVMRWYLEDVEQAIRRANKKIDPVVDGVVNDLNLPKNTECFAVGGFVRDAVLCELTNTKFKPKDIDLILSKKPDLSQNQNVLWKQENSFGGIKLGLKNFPEVDIFNKEFDWPDIVVGWYFDFNVNSLFYHNRSQQIFAAAPFYAFTSNKTIELENYRTANNKFETLYKDSALVSRALKFQVLFREKYGIDARLSWTILHLLQNMDKQTEQEMFKYTQQKVKDENLRNKIIENYYSIKSH
jgi:hypothetical protein